MPKQLPHIDREGMNKSKFAEDDGIDMNDLERFLPHLHSVFPPLPNEAEIAHTKKLFRRRRNDRRPEKNYVSPESCGVWSTMSTVQAWLKEKNKNISIDQQPLASVSLYLFCVVEAVTRNHPVFFCSLLCTHFFVLDRLYASFT
ncbi:hypothetical protein ILYODFUR_018764 [Ilyodon furcidens]|uniref:Uncharacterized protein n=1 Tax=Ilyodon furcidens TaxID=33524 RepID=A0ABV0V477_9TELE